MAIIFTLVTIIVFFVLTYFSTLSTEYKIDSPEIILPTIGIVGALGFLSLTLFM